MTAQLAYAGVRIGGTPWLPTPWRWGFGWKQFPRGYRELSDEEKRQVEKFVGPGDEPVGLPERDPTPGPLY